MTERWLTAAFVVVAISYLVAAAAIPLDPWAAEEVINTRTLPTIYGGVLAVLALSGLGARERLERLARPGVAAGLVVILLVFAIAVVALGIWLAIPVALAPAMMLLGERRAWVLVLVPLLTAIVAWVLVVRLLGIHVPSGVAFG